MSVDYQQVCVYNGIIMVFYTFAPILFQIALVSHYSQEEHLW